MGYQVRQVDQCSAGNEIKINCEGIQAISTSQLDISQDEVKIQ